MTREEFMQKYWHYYLLLEKKFINTIDYVELCEDNKATYSNEYAHLFLAIGGELDTFFKQFCDIALDERVTMNTYAYKVLTIFDNITAQDIKLLYNKKIYTPFSCWDVKKPTSSLIWWQAYDDIKHNRIDNIIKASQQNIINILGALYMLEMHYLNQISLVSGCSNLPDEKSKLFEMENWRYTHVHLGECVAELSDEDCVVLNSGTI